MRKTAICATLALAAWIATAPQPVLAQVDIGFGGTQTDGDAPVEITSDSLAIDQTTGQAVFTGNVIVVQGDLRMAAAAVQVEYAETDGRNEVQRIHATGGVLITQGDDAAEGQEAIYLTDTGMLTMTGDVLVTQGTTAIAGERMVVDMDTGNGTIEGRVRTTLRTGDE